MERSIMTHKEIREFIRSWNRQYNGGRSVDEPRLRDGIEFWRVGHNASHEFYAGVRGSKCFSYAIGDVPDEEWPEQREDESEEEYVLRALGGDIEEVPSFDGYYGHF